MITGIITKYHRSPRFDALLDVVTGVRPSSGLQVRNLFQDLSVDEFKAFLDILVFQTKEYL